MIIEVNADDIMKQSNNISEKIEEFSRSIKMFENIIDNLNTAWIGSDALSYINAMKEKNLVELNKLQTLLEEYNTFLSKVPEAYALLDEIYSSKGV